MYTWETSENVKGTTQEHKRRYNHMALCRPKLLHKNDGEIDYNKCMESLRTFLKDIHVNTYLISNSIWFHVLIVRFYSWVSVVFLN